LSSHSTRCARAGALCCEQTPLSRKQRHCESITHILRQFELAHVYMRQQGVASISPASASPLGSVNESSTRKLLINLILTLNNTFADYDFRLVH
jgi:hypothetical protein